MTSSSIIKEIENQRILGVVRADCHQRAIDISKSLIDGGVKVIEISISNIDSFKVIEEISKHKGVKVAAGSIISNLQAETAIKCGAELIVSPIFEMNLLKFCKDHRIGLMTGASTANEAYNAWKTGISITKIFPVKAMGGPQYIRDILKPMPFLRLMPTSGVDVRDFIEYIRAGAIAVGMGKAFYEEENSYKLITKKAKEATERLSDYIAQKNC